MAEQARREPPRVAGNVMASTVTLFTGDLMAVASMLPREDYQAYVMMAIDYQAFGTEPNPETCEGFENARMAFEAMRPVLDAARGYSLTCDRRALNDGAAIEEIYGPAVAEWYEG